MKKIITIIFCSLLITGCSNLPATTSNQNIDPPQQSITLKLISGNKPKYIKSDDLSYLTEEEVKQYRKDQLSYDKLTESEYEKFKSTNGLIDRHILNSVYHASVIENDNFFEKNIKPEAEFYIQNIEREEVENTYQRPDDEDESRQSMNPYKRNVLLKEEAKNNYLVKVSALNKNDHDVYCGEQDGYLFFVDVVARKVIYIEKFWQHYCE